MKGEQTTRAAQGAMGTLLVFALVLAFGILGPEAHAAPNTDSGASTASGAASGGLDGIRAQMDRGQGLFLAGKYEEAAAVFEAGYSRYPYAAFLFNAGVCHQKVGRATEALASFRAYLDKDPTAPDAKDVRERIGKLEHALSEAAEADARLGAGGAGAAPTPVNVPTEPGDGMKSLVVIETAPAGAPVRVYRRSSAQAGGFNSALKVNPGWELTLEKVSPVEATLAVGRYHIVVDEYRGYNKSETFIDVSPGHVHQFKANLSQGQFMGFLRVNANVTSAYVYLDDDAQKTVWGKTPHGELVPTGEHTIFVSAPGFKSVRRTIEVAAGDQQEIEVALTRLGYGVVRLDATVDEVTVSADGAIVGFWKKGEPAMEFTLPSGRHELLVRASGFKDLRTVVEVPEGQILPVRATMSAKYPRTAAWTQAILAAGFIGAGIYLGVESDRLNDELRADRAAGNLTSDDERMDRGFWYSIGADAGFALGGILAGFSTYNFIRDPNPDSELRRGKKLEFKDERALAPRDKQGPAQANSQQLNGRALHAGPDVLSLRPRGPETASILYVAPASTPAAEGLQP